jgi:hypothetical protein
MPGFKLLTTFDPQTCLKVAWRTAQDHGFSLTPIEGCSTRFTATKGNGLLSVVPFMPPRCVLDVYVASYPDANELVVERNEPWLTSGKIGVSKVKRQAEELFNQIACAVEKAGGSIAERKEF